MKVKSYKRQVSQRLADSFKSAVDAYDRANHDVIRTEHSWGDGFGVTYRKSGEVVVGGDRNIYDLGNLDRSQQVTMITPFHAEFSWDGNGETPAVLVHEGGMRENGSYNPPRPWTRVAYLETNLSQVMADKFNQG